MVLHYGASLYHYEMRDGTEGDMRISASVFQIKKIVCGYFDPEKIFVYTENK